MPDEIQQPVKSSKVPIFIALSLLLVVLAAAAWYILFLNKQTTKKETSQIVPKETTASKSATVKTLSNDEIFQEVSTQFGFERSEVVIFRIFGQNKVTYILDAGYTTSGKIIYKLNNKWNVAQDQMGAVVDCATLNNVPEEFRPTCYVNAPPNYRYNDDKDGHLNYPISQAVIYINTTK